MEILNGHLDSLADRDITLTNNTGDTKVSKLSGEQDRHHHHHNKNRKSHLKYQV